MTGETPDLNPSVTKGIEQHEGSEIERCCKYHK
jgi:hypothetical protein